MSIVEKLNKLGFEEFHNPMKPDHRSFQKCVKDWDCVKLYFVNVYLFDYSKWQGADKLPKSLTEDLQPEWDVQFNTYGDTFNVAWLGREPEEALEFYHKVYVNMGCDSYD